MEQPIIINIPLQRTIRPATPLSDISEMREMFHEMNQRYVVYEPSSYYYTVKRVMDLTISVLFITLIMSWLYPLVAILIKLTSKGPVLFIQKRTGYKGVEFDCFKFRTMYVNSDADTKQASSNDKRITFIGKILRLTHIDETPQFFNVLLGDMSIIGPRPHMLYHTHYYSQRIPYYNLRHEVKPGMTGMAQIKGYIGEILIERELRKRIQWDIYYLKNRSLWLDLNIFLNTLGHVFLKVFTLMGIKKTEEKQFA
jgi:putative colanic acid biosynthesis UDP-glucose lipid carrier transferase